MTTKETLTKTEAEIVRLEAEAQRLLVLAQSGGFAQRADLAMQAAGALSKAAALATVRVDMLAAVRNEEAMQAALASLEGGAK